MVPTFKTLSSILLLLVASLPAVADTTRPCPSIMRASATLNGVFSPRGFFNILVPLHKLQGVRAVKLDLAMSRITIDFAPGTSVTKDQIRQVMIDAGYRPGQVDIATLPESEASETGPGWQKIKHPHSKHAIARWAQENF